MCGSTVRQDGKSASLTAPSGQAQQALLAAALADAANAPSQLTLNEAHGTGTALGDPIEVGSFSSVVLSARRDATTPPMPLGGVKANIGHAEPAAGMTGLLKLAQALQRGHAAPNAQLHALNPHVNGALQRLLCALPTQLAALAAPWSKELTVRSKELTLGGVSSFGYSGTIAHAVLQAEQGAQLLQPASPTLPRKRRFIPGRDPAPPPCPPAARPASAPRHARTRPRAHQKCLTCPPARSCPPDPS